jgi:hypothetical protein
LEQLRHRIQGRGDCRTPFGNIFDKEIAEIAERVVAGSFQVNEFADIFARSANTISGFELGQTRDRQFDGLAELGEILSKALNQPVGAPWKMRNGYALCTGIDGAEIDIRWGHLKKGASMGHEDLVIIGSAPDASDPGPFESIHD